MFFIPFGAKSYGVIHRADNRENNLRLCTPSQNNCNQGPQRRGSSRFRGVCWHKKARKWAAAICYRGVHYHLGLFDDEVEAARARDRKALELHGEFAWLNFPEEHPARGRNGDK